MRISDKVIYCETRKKRGWLLMQRLGRVTRGLELTIDASSFE